MRLAREATRQRGDFVAAHRVLSAAAAMAGRGDVAEIAMQSVRRVKPDLSLDWIESQLPIKPQAERKHLIRALRRAGLQ